MFKIVWSTPWFNIYSYGLMIAIGYTAGTIWILREAKNSGLPVEAIFDMLIIQLIVGICGSRLLFMLEYTPDKLNIRDFFAFEQGGLTFYGSLISSFIFDLLYLKFRKIPFWQVMDCIGFGMPLGISLARLGCFFNGCCYGTECKLPWGVVFPEITRTAVHPTQIYESLCALFIFIILQVFRNKRRNFGEVFLASASLYSFFRFFIEFYRAENPIVALGMRLSQIIAILIIVASYFTWRIIAKNTRLRILPDTEIKKID
ncbi:MAG: prolipoprotein diacylglyceryl transferase [Candidatus Rifleibacteriota bacterium]